MLSMVFVFLPRAAVSAARVNEVLETEPSILDKPDAIALQPGSAGVRFDDVSFTFPGASEPAVRNISFEAAPGQTTAIIGGTGAGKTTLLNLIMRFYDVTGGAVSVGGADVRDLSQQSLRGRVGFVPQKALLFSGTVSENIRFGNPEATDEEIREAAEVAQASEFIDTLDDGYDSFIAQGGANLSGGQKQRMCIARAAARKPDIYVFDDSFSALDFRTDAKLRAALKQYTSGATVIIVAQRVSTILNADRIVVLDEGGVAGIGTHRELLDSCEVYKEICGSQLSEEELNR